MSDELAEAERWARRLVARDATAGLPPLLQELERLRAVEKAAAALVRHADALLYADGEIGEQLDALLDALSGDAP